MFKRLLIANRGEIAIRIMRAAKKLGIQTVAIYSQADENSPHLHHADLRVCIGPAPSTSSYLNMEAILQAAQQYDCQALHPGYGFLAENEMFATLCEQYKITFVGPSARAIMCMGDKANARDIMQKAGLQIIPGSKTITPDVAYAREIARDIGFPVLLKATAGGGGRGMRVCFNEEQLAHNFAEASMEAEKAFGNSALYLEKYIECGRHIEFQILADNFGNAIYLGERECSVQRRHQKLIEESPSPVLTKEERDTLGTAVAQAISKVGYRNAGTVEFLRSPQGQLYFMEMNTRLQVEHPVTEMVTGEDIVQEQIKIAANHMLSKRQDQIHFQGHAIECRINAEDSLNNFRPCPGKITRFQAPADSGPGKIRIDTFVEEGCHIPPFYDSLICKLIAWGKDRNEAIFTLKRALCEFIIEGVTTTIPFTLKVLDHEGFLAGNYHTEILEEIR